MNAAARILVAVLLACPVAALAFSAAVSPARFELRAKPGELLRQVLEISNDADTPDEYTLRTADWTLRPDGAVQFETQALAPGSCRPWVRIERRQLEFHGHSQRRFRFEIQVPEGAPNQECRFALMIEQVMKPNAAAVDGTSIRIPVQGRIGVIVYVVVGDAAPVLEIEKLSLESTSGRRVPQFTVRNTGTAHGRLDGILEGVDGAGKSFDLVVSTLPILPGETRSIPLWPQLPPGGTFAPPLRVKGRVDWDGGKQDVDATLH